MGAHASFVLGSARGAPCFVVKFEKMRISHASPPGGQQRHSEYFHAGVNGQDKDKGSGKEDLEVDDDEVVEGHCLPPSCLARMTQRTRGAWSESSGSQHYLL
eukprot:3494795-Rhodomonas_salina.3